MSEDTGVKMRSAVCFTVFAGHIKPNCSSRVFFSESSHECLEVFIFEIILIVILGIGQGYEAVMTMHGSFMDASYSPLSGFFEPAADTPAAR